MRTIALDIGTKTIGVARSDAEGFVACAHTVWPRRGNVKDAECVRDFVQAESVGRVVVGLPLELDGHIGHRARRVLAAVDVLRVVLAELPQTATVEVVTWDERFSTAAAERTLVAADLSRARRKKTIDAVAAQFILQGFLDRKLPSAHSPFAERNADASDELDPLTGSRVRE